MASPHAKSFVQIPPGVLRENFLRKTPWAIGFLQADPSGPETALSLVQNTQQTSQQLVNQYVQNGVQFSEFSFTNTFYLNADPKRTYLAIQNQTGAVMYFSTVQQGTFAQGFQIPAGLTWEPWRAPVNQISVSGTGQGFVIAGSAV